MGVRTKVRQHKVSCLQPSNTKNLLKKPQLSAMSPLQIGSRRWADVSLAVSAATLLFLANSAAQIWTYWSPPSGCAALLIPKNADNFQYLTWIEAHRSSVLIENFHTTEYTAKAYLSPLALAVGRLANWSGANIETVYQLIRLILYWVSGFVIVYSLKTFLPDRARQFAALVACFCCVPVRSLLIPILAARGSSFKFGIPGSGEYIYVSNTIFQDVNHSIFGLVGMIATVAGTAGLHRFAEHRSTGGFAVYLLACALSALCHPFEVFLLLPYGLIVLGYREGLGGAVKTLTPVFLVAVLCMSPFAVAAASEDWVKTVALLNRGGFLLPPRALVASLGVPCIVALVGGCYMAIRRAGLMHRSVVDVSVWLALSLVLPYCSWLPFPHHLLNGVSVAIGILCAVCVFQIFAIIPQGRLRKIWVVMVLVVVAGSVAAHVGLRFYGFLEAIAPARRPNPKTGFPAAFLTYEEATIMSWFRFRSAPSDSVVAPGPLAWLLAATPVHSLGSHDLFGYKKLQSDVWQQKEMILAGTSSRQEAAAFLARHHIRFVVTRAFADLPSNCQVQFRIGQKAIYDCSAPSSGP